MKNSKVFYAGMLCLSMALCGCGSKAEEKKEEPVAEKEEEKLEEALLFINSTQKTITSFKVKKSDAEKFGKNLLEKAEKLQDGVKKDFYPELEADTKYDIEFVADGKTYTVKDLVLAKMKSIELLIEGDEAYVNYEDKDGNKGTTKKEEPEEEVEVTEEAPAEEPTYEETYAEPVYDAPVYDTPVYDDGGAAAPSDDGCLSGISESDLN